MHVPPIRAAMLAAAVLAIAPLARAQPANSPAGGQVDHVAALTQNLAAGSKALRQYECPAKHIQVVITNAGHRPMAR